MFDDFNEWLCKTNFSFLHGASHPRDLVERASRLGYASLCINDFDGAYGLARCYRELDYLQQQHGDPHQPAAPLQRPSRWAVDARRTNPVSAVHR